MSEEVYVDAVGEINVTGTVVRIDFLTLSMTEKDDNGRLKPVLKHRVIMPIESFAHATEAMLQMREQMIERGVLQRVDTPANMQFTDPDNSGPPN